MNKFTAYLETTHKLVSYLPRIIEKHLNDAQSRNAEEFQKLQTMFKDRLSAEETRLLTSQEMSETVCENLYEALFLLRHTLKNDASWTENLKRLLPTLPPCSLTKSC